MLKNLPEWRAKIEEFIRINAPDFKDKVVADIGNGDSTVVVRSYNPKCVIIDKNNYKGMTNNIVADMCKAEDIYGLPKFDAVFCCEVLEHVDNPFIVAENLKKIVVPGGLIYITVPCYLPWHPGTPYYDDYWRFMPTSLKRLFSPNKVIETVCDSKEKGMPYGICAKVFV
jgi:SAM-dependent methyltransferase